MIICGRCGHICFDADRGPVYALFTHREEAGHGNAESRVFETVEIRPLCPNPEPMQRALARDAYQKAKAKAVAS